VLDAGAEIGKRLRHGQLVVLESTTYPGTTREELLPILERESGLVAGRDFHLAFSPERVDPGRVDWTTKTVPKVVGGIDDASTEAAAALYLSAVDEVHRVSSPDAAELTKLLENIFRSVNIALVNELAQLCDRMGIDIWEVVDAAATKPFGFMPFWPGPGVGGHCIPVDPYYLVWRARQFGVADRFIELAADINGSMPAHVAELVASALSRDGRQLQGARVGIVGVAFKPNVRDSRNSPAASAITELAARGAVVSFHDPHVARLTDTAGNRHESVQLDQLLDESDVVVVLVKHDAIDWSHLYDRAKLVIDAVNSSSGRSVRPGQVLRLGAGWS
jgi:UDP-N-acetyl-D-glucosamine dehydrogenase